MSAPHSAEAPCKGKSCPHFSQQPMCSGASTVPTSRLKWRHKRAGLVDCTLHGFRVQGQAKRFMQTKEKKWDLGWWAWASSASSSMGSAKKCGDSQDRRVPARDHISSCSKVPGLTAAAGSSGWGLTLTSQKSSHELALGGPLQRKNICVTSFDFQQPVLGQCLGRPATKLLGRQNCKDQRPARVPRPTVSSSGPTATTSPPTSGLSIQANGSTFTKGPGHTPGSLSCSIQAQTIPGGHQCHCPKAVCMLDPRKPVLVPRWGSQGAVDAPWVQCKGHSHYLPPLRLVWEQLCCLWWEVATPRLW